MQLRCDDSNRDSSRGDAVGDHFERGEAAFDGGRDVELGRDGRAAGGDAHGAVVVRAAVEDVMGGVVGDAHQGVVGGGLSVVAVGGALREAVELGAGDDVVQAAR